LRVEGGLRGEDGLHVDVALLELTLEGLVSGPPPLLSAALARAFAGSTAKLHPLQLGYT